MAASRAYQAGRAHRSRQALRRQMRLDGASTHGERAVWAQPMQYDESGFPVSSRMPTFGERVRRLLLVR